MFKKVRKQCKMPGGKDSDREQQSRRQCQRNTGSADRSFGPVRSESRCPPELICLHVELYVELFPPEWIPAVNHTEGRDGTQGTKTLCSNFFQDTDNVNPED